VLNRERAAVATLISAGIMEVVAVLEKGSADIPAWFGFQV
jgi:hypothetical protein